MHCSAERCQVTSCEKERGKSLRGTARLRPGVLALKKDEIDGRRLRTCSVGEGDDRTAKGDLCVRVHDPLRKEGIVIRKCNELNNRVPEN